MSPVFSLRVSPSLDDICKARWRSLGYPSRNAYLKALIRRDAIKQPTHTTLKEWAFKLPQDQDRLDAEILERLRAPSVEKEVAYRGAA